MEDNFGMCASTGCNKNVYGRCKTCEEHLPQGCSFQNKEKEYCGANVSEGFYYCSDHKKEIDLKTTLKKKEMEKPEFSEKKCIQKKCGKKPLENGKCIFHGGRDKCSFVKILNCTKILCPTFSNNFGRCSKHGKELGQSKKCAIYGCKNTFGVKKNIDRKYCGTHSKTEETKTTETDKKPILKKRSAETIESESSNKKINYVFNFVFPFNFFQ